MREIHAVSRIGLSLLGTGLLITLVLSVGLKCLEPFVEKTPDLAGLEAIIRDYRSAGIFLCAVGTIVVLVTMVITDDDDRSG